MGVYDDFGLEDTVRKKKSLFSRFVSLCLSLVIVFLCLMVLVPVLTNTGRVEEYDVIDMDLSDIPAPLQTSTTGGTTMEIDGSTLNINYVAEYELYGRVIDLAYYGGKTLGDKLSPRDIGVAWGYLASDEAREKVKWSSIGNRFLNNEILDFKWYQAKGGRDAFVTHHSNNHLIPANDEVEKKVKKIREDDYVKVTGYLVRVQGTNGFRWGTSTSRTDDGNGACEVIYVTDVKWLR